MNGVKTLSPERIAEIKAFKNTDFSDCPVMTEEELKKLRPRHPQYYKQENQAVQNCFDAQPSPQTGEGSPLEPQPSPQTGEGSPLEPQPSPQTGEGSPLDAVVHG